MQEKRHDCVVEMWLCFFSRKAGDYKMLFVATRKCRSTGHDYEEMTEQYIDYMPKKIEKASEEYFSRHSLAACMKRGEKTDG